MAAVRRSTDRARARGRWRSRETAATRERTKKAVYKNVTLTIPSNAIVRDNKQQAPLGQLKSGQKVLVVSGLNRTRVAAR